MTLTNGQEVVSISAVSRVQERLAFSGERVEVVACAHWSGAAAHVRREFTDYITNQKCASRSFKRNQVRKYFSMFHLSTQSYSCAHASISSDSEVAARSCVHRPRREIANNKISCDWRALVIDSPFSSVKAEFFLCKSKVSNIGRERVACKTLSHPNT